MQVSSRTLGQLRAVFGDCVPKENALAMLEASPAQPQAATELAALRAVVRDAAGRKIVDLATFAQAQELPRVTAPLKQPDAHRLLLAQVQGARDLKGVDGLKKVLREDEVARLFTRAAADADIPWGFLEEGCLHRSHVLAKKLEDEGVFCEKIFTIPLGGDLVMDTPKARLGFTVCWYHEAVAVWVQTKDGAERRVIDPSCGDRALTVDEWLATMHSSTGTPLETFFLPRFAYGLSARDNPPSAWDVDDLATAMSWKDQWRDVEKSLDEMDFYSQLKELAGRG